MEVLAQRINPADTLSGVKATDPATEPVV